MVVIQHGDHTVLVQKRAEVESKLESELAPIHLQVLEERTAAGWGQVLQAENAIIRNAQVRCAINCVCLPDLQWEISPQSLGK